MSLVQYPIQPCHLDTSAEPKGFDAIIRTYDEKILVWGFMEFCQHRQNWNSFTMEEFLVFLGDRTIRINAPLRTACMTFPGSMLHALFDRQAVADGGPETFIPRHFVITTYFMWNPAKDLESTGILVKQ